MAEFSLSSAACQSNRTSLPPTLSSFKIRLISFFITNFGCS